MKWFIREVHLELNAADMLKALNMYMSNLGVVCIPGSVPSWWPPKLDHDEEYINLNKDGKYRDTLFLSHQLTLDRPDFCYRLPSPTP
jgi:hypothetical protein